MLGEPQFTSKKSVGINPYKDMRRFVKTDEPVIFDIGAHEGESVELFLDTFSHWRSFPYLQPLDDA